MSYCSAPQKFDAAPTPPVQDSPWRSIESAPHDGTTVLLTDGLIIKIGRWKVVNKGQNVRDSYKSKYWSVEARVGAMVQRDMEWTHWAPVPKPPGLA